MLLCSLERAVKNMSWWHIGQTNRPLFITLFIYVSLKTKLAIHLFIIFTLPWFRAHRKGKIMDKLTTTLTTPFWVSGGRSYVLKTILNDVQ
jgi:hypothetical protein